MLTDGLNKWFSYEGQQTYSFDRHLCPGGKLEFSGLWKLGKNGTYSARALFMRIYSVDESHNWIYFILRTYPKLYIEVKRNDKTSSPKKVEHYFQTDFPFDQLVYGYIKCEDLHLDVYFMDKFLFTIPDHKSWHGPFNKVMVAQPNGFFELKSLTMSEGLQ